MRGESHALGEKRWDASGSVACIMARARGGQRYQNDRTRCRTCDSVRIYVHTYLRFSRRTATQDTHPRRSRRKLRSERGAICCKNRNARAVCT